MPKIGIKIYSPDQVVLLPKIRDVIDFIEIMGVQTYDFSVLDTIGLPIVIHAEHENFNINLSNPAKAEANRRSIQFSLDLADRFNVEKIIVHPGFREDDMCSEEQSTSIYRSFDDPRILIESMPFKIGTTEFFAYDVQALSRMSVATMKGICIDVSHSTKAAIQLNQDPVVFMKELFNLDCRHVHFSDLIYATLSDHQHLGKGNAPLEAYLQYIPKDCTVTIETDKDSEDAIREDILFLRNRM